MNGLLAGLGLILDTFVDDELRDRVERMGWRTNAYGYDRWGASPADARRMLVVMRLLYRHYFRVEAHGLEHIPEGRVLLIGNHSAQLAYDGMLVTAALALEAEPPRRVQAMVERFFANVPLVNTLMTRWGHLTGIPGNAERLLTQEDAALLVFPEGARGGGKLFKDRYKLMGFGQGFMRLALKTATPIVPFAFIGGEEMTPSFSSLQPLAHLLGTPYVPLTPTIVPLPLPTKCSILFGEPMRMDLSWEADDEQVDPLVAQVEAEVASLIERGLAARTGVFF